MATDASCGNVNLPPSSMAGVDKVAAVEATVEMIAWRGWRSCQGCAVEREVPTGKTVHPMLNFAPRQASLNCAVQMCAGIYYLLTMLRHASRMSPVSASHLTRADHMDQGVDARHLSLGHRGLVMPFASDPELTARREIKLLRIEVEQLRAVERMLRAELEVLRADRDEDRKTKELFFAYAEEVEQLFESQNYPEREAERSSGLRSHRWFFW